MRVRMGKLVQMTMGRRRNNRLGLGSLSLPVAFTPLLLFSAPCVPSTPIHASGRLGTPSGEPGSHIRSKLPFTVTFTISHLSLALRRQFPVTWVKLSVPHFAISLDQLSFSVPLEVTFSLHETGGTLDSSASRTDDWGARCASGADHDACSTYSRTKGISCRTCSNRRGSLKYAHRRL